MNATYVIVSFKNSADVLSHPLAMAPASSHHLMMLHIRASRLLVFAQTHELQRRSVCVAREKQQAK